MFMISSIYVYEQFNICFLVVKCMFMSVSNIYAHTVFFQVYVRQTRIALALTMLVMLLTLSVTMGKLLCRVSLGGNIVMATSINAAPISVLCVIATEVQDVPCSLARRMTVPTISPGTRTWSAIMPYVLRRLCFVFIHL